MRGEVRRVGFFGPRGTFTEEALMSLPELAVAEHVPYPTIPDVLRAAEDGEVELGIVPIENSIEGTVSAALDHLVFDSELLIQLEVVLDIHLQLLAAPGTTLEQVRSVVSYPHASAQCRRFIRERLGDAEVRAANSTADAARLVGEERPPCSAAIAPRLAGELYGLVTLAEGIEDFGDNQTRFLAVAPHRVPPATGHDKTSIVCFQAADHPGSLHEILGQFSARSLNLTKIESRPTKRSLGDYCFVIDLEGHVSDEVVGDCLRELHSALPACKFLGSYPAASEHGPAVREAVSARRRQAAAWLDDIRKLVEPA
ncbi:MAG TPA: prephenate dehydratase [Acidimicrobiales bacterium]|nr:prephenate dehydratase [Acidimicrobiales bacterium]